MTSISFPGPEFPASPAVTIDCPDGWSALRGVGYVLAVGQDGTGPDDYQPIVVASIARLPDRTTMQEAIAHVVATLRTTADSTEIARDEVDLAGRPGFLMEASYTHPRGLAVRQAVRFAWVDHDDVIDMVQLIGACAVDQTDEVWDTVRGIQESLTLG